MEVEKHDIYLSAFNYRIHVEGKLESSMKLGLKNYTQKPLILLMDYIISFALN